MNGPAIYQISFSQHIRLEWLERTTDLVLAGNDRTGVNNALQEMLGGWVFTGGRTVWGNPRDEGLRMLEELPRKDHPAVHWGMTLAAYPFWGAVAMYTGRLLRLQGTVTAAHIQQRIKEQYGERETVSRATRQVLRSLVAWGLLSEIDRGLYAPGNQYPVQDPAHRLVDRGLFTGLHERLHHPRGPARQPRGGDISGLYPHLFP